MKTRPIEKPTVASDVICEQDDGLANLKSSAATVDLRSIELIELIAATTDRLEAISLLVRFVGDQYPDCSVRCGIGAASMRRFMDRKLGWLGPASDLFQQAMRQWEDDPQTNRHPNENGERQSLANLPVDAQQKGFEDATSQDSLVRNSIVRINIDDDQGPGRCVLWIDGDSIKREDRSWLRKTLPTVRSLLWHQSGTVTSHLLRRLGAYGASARLYLAISLVAFVILASWPVSYRVRCTSVVRPMHARVISAPFESRLEASHVKLGQAVAAGDVLMTLDGRPLRLELDSIDAQIAQVEKERDIALASGKIADGQQAKLRYRELNRKRDLLLGRLKRLEVISPIDGVIVSGDLDRSIGMTLEMGQAVLEVAPLDWMVIELEIPEAEIGFVSPDDDARVRLSSLSNTVIDRPIASIHPSAEIRDDRNVFVARIELENANNQLRPGMRGDAIAYGPVRPWLWSSLRKLLDNVIWWIGY
ncbi:efflux RND transporter periplasmic adaptor subunit [Roseiconus lacunae]|uniref:efflux RND transporter periplasmic adaptor subunit n=1 Tax=Roseiconus lacunae TaxID=2605694 RepID=UPI001E510D56|nr:efflux RND transporter periplasmic adaptor subunit [Roseiconus lacunae]MCD0459037.1 efflux RND transporter periplasmic adaptor subunit [Roseiconus lacunae]